VHLTCQSQHELEVIDHRNCSKLIFNDVQMQACVHAMFLAAYAHATQHLCFIWQSQKDTFLIDDAK
jgi:hypothetical protein